MISLSLSLGLAALFTNSASAGSALTKDKLERRAASKSTETKAEPRTIGYDIVSVDAQNPEYFVQGYAIRDQQLFISSGGYSSSRVVIENLDRDSGGPSSKVLLDKRLPDFIFAEGLTHTPKHTVVLSWRAGLAFFFDDSMTLQFRRRYQHEGWGLAYDAGRDDEGKRREASLLVSDGSERIRAYDLEMSKIQRTYVVSSEDGPLNGLNELETVGDILFINRWTKNEILIYDLNRAALHGVLDLSAITKKHRKLLRYNRDAVLNGIAYDNKQGGLWITGKLWPKRYLIRPKMSELF